MSVRLRVTYVHSAIGFAADQKRTVAALGLRRLHQSVDHPDSASLRGMVHKVRHLVHVVPIDSPLAANPTGSGRAADVGEG
ncbi:MAG TPA: 50S ribosomal protein L30 [Verrucomicrobiae bacterium]|nr:50S ribosomal protein L30 [Verrucomicrobiae bacterium]